MRGKDYFIDGIVDHTHKPNRSMANFVVGANSIPIHYKKSPEQPKPNYGDPLVINNKRQQKSQNTTLGYQTRQPIFATQDSADKPNHTPEPVSNLAYKKEVLGMSDDEIIMSSEDLSSEKLRNKEEKRAQKSLLKRNDHRLFIFKHKVVSFVFIPLLILIIVVYFWGDSIANHITNGQSGLFDFIRSAIAGEKNTLQVDLKTGRTNILIFGTSGYDMNGSEGNGTHDGSQLTDSIMIASYNNETGDVSIISIPRDLKTDTCRGSGKINEIFTCANSEKAGAEALESRVSELFGINFQYWVHLDWTALIQIVNALDGITVTLDEDINDDWTKTYIKAGVETTLNGEQALGLARARHGTEHGDFSRGSSQQKIIMAIANKIKSRGLGATDIVNLAGIFGDNLRSSFTAGEITAAAKNVVKSSVSIRQISILNYLSAGYINGISYVYPKAGVNNYEDIKKYLSPAVSADPDSTENANIMILNGSGVDSATSTEKTELVNSGFNVSSTGDAPAGNYFKKLYVYQITDKKITASKLKSYYNIDILPSSDLPTGINTKDIDFVIILGVGYNS